MIKSLLHCKLALNSICFLFSLSIKAYKGIQISVPSASVFFLRQKVRSLVPTRIEIKIQPDGGKLTVWIPSFSKMFLMKATEPEEPSGGAHGAEVSAE